MKFFKIGTEIYFDENSLNYLKTISGKNIFIVMDKFMIENGMLDTLKEKLIDKNIKVFSDVAPDPTIEIVSSGIDCLKGFIPDVVIALGGGSVIDATKAIIHFGKNILNIDKVLLIAIPTTSGTGSEVTSFSVITDKEKGIKYPLVSDKLLPDIAILEPNLTKTVPKHITADTGMDVLTHSIEAYVSKNANDFSDALAIKSILLVFENLELCYKDGNNIKAREKMHIASCLAGMAFNSASLGINHSIAHILGGKYHIPHGRANAILLPYIIEFNSNIIGYENSFSKTAIRYSEIAKFIGSTANNTRSNVRYLINKILTLQKNLNIPKTLKETKIDLSNFELIKEEMAKIALEDKCTITNPILPTKEDIIKILEKVKG
ncbi:1-propanol dehydrogenase PduQ [[Clostridium] colinum]|uniref:1-propanol dehydrogenase PduQ n=1 Tax=[Clostridium] colinum TaxID=36835 RepID=UPI002025478C|nr:1-propanol dehydrogenase PduQ [[Clostridium] colinum]